jgi:hypothetical protein
MELDAESFWAIPFIVTPEYVPVFSAGVTEVPSNKTEGLYKVTESYLPAKVPFATVVVVIRPDTEYFTVVVVPTFETYEEKVPF